MSPVETDRRRLWLAVLLVFAFALALRVGHVGLLKHGLAGTQLFSAGRVDAAEHLREAADILEGDPWLRDRVQWKGPGYSYFLAFWMKLLGRDAGNLRWVTAALGALNCAALVLLARRFLGVGGAAAAGSLAAVNGIVLLFDAELYFPTLLISLSLGMFGLLLAARGGLAARAAAGVLLGLCVVVHPAYLLAGLAIVVWLVHVRPASALAFATAAMLTILPVTLRHWMHHGQPVLVAWNGGINFYLGNQPGFDQLSGQDTQAWDRVYLSPLDAGVTREIDRDRLYYRLAWREISGSPQRALRIFADKLRIFLAPVEIANNFQLYELRERSALLAATLARLGPLYVPFGIWAPLAWCGAVILARRKAHGNGLIVLWGLALALSCVLFFNTARYRVPLVFVGSIWAAATLEAAWLAIRSRDWQSLSKGLVLVLGLGVLTALLARPQPNLPPPLELTEARIQEQAGRVGTAARLLEQVVRDRPDDPAMLLAAAAFHGRIGREERHRELLRRTLELDDLGPDDRFNAYEMLGESHLRDRDLDAAEASFRAALLVGIDDPVWRGEPYFRLHLGPLNECRIRLAHAELYARRGDVERARRTVREVDVTCEPHGRIAARRERVVRLVGSGTE